MTTTLRVGRDQVLAFRLAGHHLHRRQPLASLDVVAGACGIRNTPPGSAALALPARVDGLSPELLDRALTEGKHLVEVLGRRASPLLVPVADVAIFTLGALPATEESLLAALPTHGPILSRVGFLAGEALHLAAEIAWQELEGGMIERGALSAAMTRRLPETLCPWCQPCGVHHVNESLFRLVGVRGVWVIGPRGGKRTFHVRTDHWLGAAIATDPVTARLELLRRYLRCYGPSTVEHFAAWVGITPADAQTIWELIADQFVGVEIDGRRAWLHADDRRHLERSPTPTGVRLLPPYDSYLDQRDRETLLPNKAMHRRVWQSLGNPGVVLSDGEVVGTWRPQKKGKRLIMTVEPFGTLSPSVWTDSEAEAARLAPFRNAATVELLNLAQ